MRLEDMMETIKSRDTKKRDYPTYRRGDDVNFWVGFVYASFKEGLLTGKETVSLCLEFEAKGAGNTAWFKTLKEEAYCQSKNE